MKTKGIPQRLVSFLTAALWMMEALLFTFLALLNLRYTAYFDLSSETAKNEYVLYKNDSLLLFLAVFALGAAAAWLLYRALRKIPPVWLLAGLGLFAAVLGWWWVQNSGYAHRSDQHSLYVIAWNLLENNFCDIQPGEYLFFYPFQLGFAAFLEQLYRLFGGGNTFPLTVLNWLGTVASYLLLCHLSAQLFCQPGEGRDEGVRVLHPLLMLGCLPGLLFIHYVYGNVLGGFFGILALDLLLCWGRTRRLPCFVGACLSIAFAIQLKSFNMILLIAMAIFLLLDALRQKSWRGLAYLLALLAAAIALQASVQAVYTRRAGQPLPQGAPKVLWIAMGMQDSWFEHGAPGWYNMFNYSTYSDTDFDQEESKRIAYEAIRARLGEFAAQPEKAVTFYKKKIISQWAEPTYQGFAISYDILHPDKYGGWMQRIYYGDLQALLVRLMKWYQTAVWVLAALCLWGRGRKFTAAQLLPGLVIVGGFLFQLFWEGKSQYVLPYFLLATVYAVAGLSWLLKKAEEGRRVLSGLKK